MSRKNRKPIYTLSQDEAERLVAEVKNSVEKLFVMPAAGERNAEFHVNRLNFSLALLPLGLPEGVHSKCTLF